MKRLFFSLILISAITRLLAADWVSINSDQPVPAEYKLISSNISTSVVQFTLDGFYKTGVSTEKGDAWLLKMDNAGYLLKIGAPELPLFAASLIIPDEAGMKVEIVSFGYTEYKNVLIAPSKGNLSRTVDPSTIPYEFGKQYETDAFYPGRIARLSDPYIVRDYRGLALQILPFQYNPATRVLRVYHNIIVKVVENGSSSVNVLHRKKPLTGVDSRFRQVYKKQFLNYNASGERYEPVDEEGSMIIISYGDFIDEIQPLADWKNKRGIPCSVTDVADIGGSADIKQFIQNAFDFDDVAFVLLVGDAAQVPSSMIGGNDSDVDYSYCAGDDHYPDLFVGRFSAETEDQVSTMVQRTLDYETNPVTDTAWYTKAIGIASSQGPGDQGEYDYEHIRNIGNNKLIPFTYNYAYELFDGSQGGQDADGNPTPAMVAADVDSGATIINYCGHGSTTSWGTSGFNNGNVNSLTNTGKLPFIFSVACVNGNFVNNTCFAEAWLRATDNDGDPTGAMATLMSTINQSWNPPMRGQDAMNDILTEAYPDNIKRTFGGIAMNGCMEMNDVYGSAGYEMTDTWTIFGDPSLLIRTAVPADMTVIHPDTLSADSSSLTLTCDAEGGLAVLSFNGQILGTEIIVDSSATITFNAIEEEGSADIVVTAFNYRPYISTIEMILVNNAYVVYANNRVNDSLGNNDTLVDYNEDIFLTVGLTNIGSIDAGDVYAELSSTSPYINFLVSGAGYDSIRAGDTVSVANAFRFEVADSIPDDYEIDFTVSAQNLIDSTVWESEFSLTAHAPVLNYAHFTIDDSNGNDNGKLDPGETANLIVNFSNTGSSAAYNVNAQLTTNSEYVNILTDEINTGDLFPGDNAQAVFQVQAAGDTPEGNIAELNLNLVADHDIHGHALISLIVGQKPILILNLCGDVNPVDSITSCLDTLEVGATVTGYIPDTLDIYRSVFVLLGYYPNNHVLTQSEGEHLAQFLNNGGRIYMEGGDTWAYDDPTPVHEMFFIDGVDDGSDDLSVIVGEEQGFLNGFAFDYGGINSSIDRIEPKTGATLLMSNQNPYYGVMVSYDGDTYKTIGSSCQFAGFIDQPGSTKDEVMADMLSFFGVGYTWTGIREQKENATDVTAYPNPFTQNVNISFNLKSNAQVTLDVFDLTGRKVATLVDKELKPGRHQFTWNAQNKDGQQVQPGVYFYRLNDGNRVSAKKLILTR